MASVPHLAQTLPLVASPVGASGHRMSIDQYPDWLSESRPLARSSGATTSSPDADHASGIGEHARGASRLAVGPEKVTAADAEASFAPVDGRMAPTAVTMRPFELATAPAPMSDTIRAAGPAKAAVPSSSAHHEGGDGGAS